MLGQRGVLVTLNVWISETILIVYKEEHLPFNAQQNIYEYHYFERTTEVFCIAIYSTARKQQCCFSLIFRPV